MSTENTFVNEPDRVVIYDDFAYSVIFDQLDYNDHDAISAAFKEQFEVLADGHFLADPDEDFYQGISVMAIIKRKEDGRLFGYQYWTPVSKHGEASIEANGNDHGLEFEPPSGFDWDNDYFPNAYVWLPVEPFTITGYKITEESK